MTRALRRRETGGPADADVADRDRGPAPAGRARAHHERRAGAAPRWPPPSRAAGARRSTASCRSSLSASPSSCAPGSARIRNERRPRSTASAPSATRAAAAGARRSQRLEPERPPEGRRPAHQPRRRARRQRPQAPRRARGRVAVGRDGRPVARAPGDERRRHARGRGAPVQQRRRSAAAWAARSSPARCSSQLVGAERAEEIIGDGHRQARDAPVRVPAPHAARAGPRLPEGRVAADHRARRGQRALDPRPRACSPSCRPSCRPTSPCASRR